VTYADYEKLKTTKQYTKFIDDLEERHFNHSVYGTADVYTQNNVPFFKYPVIMTKVAKLNNEMDAALSSLRLTVNFVEFDIDVKKTYGYDVVTTTGTADASAVVKIECVFNESVSDNMTAGGLSGPGLIMTNNKLFMTWFTNKTIYEPMKAEITAYSDKVPKFSGRKFRVFGGSMKLGTFVVSVSRDEYKRAVLAGLTRYADYVATLTKSYNQ